VATVDQISGRDGELFRAAMSTFATGITVVTARVDSVSYGLTATAVTSVSLEPPTLLVCLNRRSRTAAAIVRGGAFAVSVLGEHQLDIAELFARPDPDRFAELETELGPLGQPLVADALAHVECRLVSELAGGTHRVLVGRVGSAMAWPCSPLVRFRGGYGRFDASRDQSLA
jgi:4-nitrophenol 2-monooxygenase / 4-nitrocatechol 4-monooxygenase, reductase component